jgi:hypothetical protein
MTDEVISPLRRRMIEDMTIRKLVPKTQQGYIRNVKAFAAFLGRSPGTASREDVRRFQLHLTSSGAGTPKINSTVTALRFFFDVTLDRPDIAKHLLFVYEPRKLPVGESQSRHPKVLVWTMGQQQKVKASGRPTRAGRSRGGRHLPLFASSPTLSTASSKFMVISRSRRSPANMCESFVRPSNSCQFGVQGNYSGPRSPNLWNGQRSIPKRRRCLPPLSTSYSVAFRLSWCGLAIMGSSQITCRGPTPSRICD